MLRVGKDSTRARWVLTKRAAVLGLLALPIGCGGGQPSAQTPADEAPAKKSAPPAPAKPKLPPLEPVDAPPGVVARLRIQSPGKSVDGAVAAAGVPFDWRTILASQDEDAARILDEVVDIDGPLEGLVALNARPRSEPYAIISFSVRSVDAVVQELSRNTIESNEGPGGVHYFTVERGEGHCAVGRSLGPSPARVACSASEPSLMALLPYALRGFPTQELSDADVHFDLDARPLQKTYGRQVSSLKLLASVGARQLHVDHPKLDRAITDAAVGLSDELVDWAQDIEMLSVQLYAKEDAYDLRMTERYTGDRSWTVGALRELGGKQETAPALFDKIPSTASAAHYTRTLSTERTQPFYEVLADLASGYAEYKGASPRLAAKIERAIELMRADGQTQVAAMGPVALNQLHGESVVAPAWQVYGTNTPAREQIEFLDSLVDVLSSKEFAKLLKSDAEYLPSFKRYRRPIAGLKGATVYKFEFPDAFVDKYDDLMEETGQTYRPSAALVQQFYLAVKDMDGASWLAGGNNEASLVEAFDALATKGTQRLADLGELDGVRSRQAVAAGFGVIDAFVGGPLRIFVPSNLAKQWPSMRRGLPHDGRARATAFFTVDTEGATVATLEYRLPVELVTDAFALGALVATEFGVDLPK